MPCGQVQTKRPSERPCGGVAQKAEEVKRGEKGALGAAESYLKTGWADHPSIS